MALYRSANDVFVGSVRIHAGTSFEFAGTPGRNWTALDGSATTALANLAAGRRDGPKFPPSGRPRRMRWAKTLPNGRDRAFLV